MSKIKEPMLKIPVRAIHSSWKTDIVVNATISAMVTNNFRHSNVNYFTIPILCEYIFGVPEDTPDRSVEMAVHRMELERQVSQVAPGLYAVTEEASKNLKGHVLIPIRVFKELRESVDHYADILMVYSYLLWKRNRVWDYTVGETSLALISAALSCPLDIVRDCVETLVERRYIAIMKTRSGFLYSLWEESDKLDVGMAIYT